MSYEVLRRRPASATVTLSKQKGQDKRIRTLEEQYIVIFDPDTIEANVPDPASVSLLSGVPQVGGWSYYDAIAGVFYPKFTCRSVSIERREDNAFIYDITASYADESADDSGQTPPASDPEGYNPTVSYTLEEMEVSSWVDNQNDPIMLPTGNLYEGINPTKKVPIVVYQIEQIENSFDKDDLTDRCYTVNSSTWEGFPPDTAMITDIKYAKAQVPVGGGVPIYVNAYKVNYTIKCLTAEIKSRADDETIETLRVKHGLQMARTDIYYLKTADDISTKTIWEPDQKSGWPSSLYLKEDGTGHRKSLQVGVPPIDQYVTQPRKSFSFLRV